MRKESISPPNMGYKIEKLMEEERISIISAFRLRPLLLTQKDYAGEEYGH